MTEECKWSFTKDGQHREFILPGPFGQARGKKVCQDCLKYLGWHEPAEKSVTPVSADDRGVFHLLKDGPLPEWEAKFISDISKRHELTEKQRTIFDRIKNQYLSSKTSTQIKNEAQKYDFNDDDFAVPF